MLVRFGNVLYWTGCVATVMLIVGAIWVLSETGDKRPGFIAFVFAPAVVVWLVSRACRYVFSGR